MKATFLGQAGWLIDTNGVKILIDPYLSDYVKSVNPAAYRRQPIDERYLHILPDFLLVSHDHIDHNDPETMPHYLDAGGHITVLTPRSVWDKIRKADGNNYVDFNRHSVWREKGITVSAVKAAHSDPAAIGFLIEAEGKTLYYSGDTLYNTEIFDDVPLSPDAMMVVVNGVGNNMNMEDAKALAARLTPKTVFPMHFGMLDDTTPEEIEAKAPDWTVPRIYETYNI